jgi:pimeloyl-ACP methyl ester carboxylesterase
MIASLAKFLDWSAIQAVAMMKSAEELNNPRLTEALELLKSPDFLPADSQPAQIESNGSLHFHFPTPRPSDYQENNVAYGRLYRCPGRWQEQPVIILMPGWRDSGSYYLRFPLLARRCNRAGFNAVTLVPPYHFQRLPREYRMFDLGDLCRLAESTAQAIAEIRALTGWLLREGCPGVALWGYSQGAWCAGMTACCDERMAAAVLAAPPARCRPWVQLGAVRPRIRAQLQHMRKLCDELNGTVMNLTASTPVISLEKILLIEAAHDNAICTADDTEELWQSWGRPDIWRLPHGHVGVCCGFAPGLPGRVLRWLAARLEKPALREQPDRTAQPDGAANRSQPAHSETNQASAAAGSGR